MQVYAIFQNIVIARIVEAELRDKKKNLLKLFANNVDADKPLNSCRTISVVLPTKCISSFNIQIFMSQLNFCIRLGRLDLLAILEDIFSRIKVMLSGPKDECHHSHIRL